MVLEPLWSLEVFRQAKEVDPVVGKVMYLIRIGWEGMAMGGGKASNDLWKHRKHLSLNEQGVLMVKISKMQSQVVLPACFVGDFLSPPYELPKSGHLGIEETLEKVRDGIYWLTWFNVVSQVCRTCSFAENGGSHKAVLVDKCRSYRAIRRFHVTFQKWCECVAIQWRWYWQQKWQ